jgi:hypothetical protein
MVLNPEPVYATIFHVCPCIGQVSEAKVAKVACGKTLCRRYVTLHSSMKQTGKKSVNVKAR